MSNDQSQTAGVIPLLAKAMQALTCGVVITDPNGVIVWGNAGLSRLTGYALEELLGKSTAIFHSGEQDDSFYHNLWTTILSREAWSGKVANRCKDGSLCYVEELIVPIFDESGDLANFVALQLDMAPTGRILFEQQWLAYHDCLTRLPNRARFMECLKQTIDECAAKRHMFAVMFLDLDRFKPVNDTYGHHMGDLLLKAIANRLRAALRRTDIVARLGGDEFTVIVKNLGDTDQSSLLAEKIIASLSRPFRLERHDIQIGVSVGVTLFPADGTKAELLLERADRAMYSAKAAGGNRLCLYRDLPSKNLAQAV